MGVFLPVVCLTTSELARLRDDPNLKLLKPLSEALYDGMWTRFALGETMGKVDYLLASAFHPQFKTEWMLYHYRLADDEEENTYRVNHTMEFIVKTMKELVLEELKKVQIQKPHNPAAASAGSMTQEQIMEERALEGEEESQSQNWSRGAQKGADSKEKKGTSSREEKASAGWQN